MRGVVAVLIELTIFPSTAQHQWQTVFYISAGIFLFGALQYAVFFVGKKQASRSNVSLCFLE